MSELIERVATRLGSICERAFGPGPNATMEELARAAIIETLEAIKDWADGDYRQSWVNSPYGGPAEILPSQFIDAAEAFASAHNLTLKKEDNG